MNRFPPKTILVPFDFYDLSLAAWRRAVELAALFGAKLEVLHVRARGLPAELAALPPREPEGETAARIRARVGAEARILLADGDPADAILRRTRARRPDLIVMGTHGRAGLERAVLGSVTEAVVRRSPVPVLAARGAAARVSSILAPVNFTSHSYLGFAYAASLAAALGARLTALHVHLDPIWNGDPAPKLEALREELPAPLRPRFAAFVEHGQTGAAKGILKSCAGHELVVLVAREKSPLKDLLLGTTAERVLRGAPSSVLLLPAPRRPLRPREDLPGACCAA